jgi:hypothetical protein
VRPAELSPLDSEARVLNLLLALVDVSDTLTLVEGGIRGRVDAWEGFLRKYFLEVFRKLSLEEVLVSL